MSLQHFTAAQIKRVTSRDEYADGMYVAKVTGAKKLEGDTAPEGLQLSLAMLTDPNDVESAHRMTMNVRLPLGATDTSGPVANFQLQQSAEFATVLFDDLEGIPTWNRDTKQNEVFGAPVEKSEADALKAANTEAALNRMVDVYNDEEAIKELAGKTFCCVVERSKPATDGRVFANVRRPLREVPEGAELQAAENFVHIAADDDAAEAPAPVKAPAKKPAAKPAKRR